MRYLTLPVADADIQAWIDRAAEKHAGDYRIETFNDDVPAELVPESSASCSVSSPSTPRQVRSSSRKR